MKLPPIKRPNRKKRVHCTKCQESKYATRFSTNLILHAANKTKETFQLPENKFWKYFLFGWPIVIIPSFLKKIRKSLCGLKLFVKTSNSCMMVNFFFPALHIEPSKIGTPGQACKGWSYQLVLVIIKAPFWTWIEK